MIGIERIEIDRSQVLNPVSGNYFGIVLQVPYGPITPQGFSTEGTFLEAFSIPDKSGHYLPDPKYKDYYEALVLLKQTPILACRPQGDALFGGVLVEDATTGNTVSGLGTGIASVDNYTFPNTDTQFIIAGADPSADNNNYSIEILPTISEIDNTFLLKLYYKDVLQNSWDVSLVSTQKDDFGNSVYIEEVLKNRSDIQVRVNSNADLTILPYYTSSAVNLSGGITISNFSDTSDIISAWNNFKDFNKYYTNYLVDTSCNEVIGKAVNDIAVDNWYQFVFLGAPSIKVSNSKATEELNTWKTSVLAYRDIDGVLLNISSDHSGLFVNWGEVNDNYNNTTVWVSPVSTAAARRAFTNKNIGFSQAAAGLNAGRGITNDFIQLEQDPQSIADELEQKQINILTYSPGGKVIWNERTLQTKYSNTSFQSHRILFSTLEENIESLLITFNFTDNNETPRSELSNLIADYITPMIGVHLYDAEVKCNSDNNPPSLINQRKMKVQIAVIPYAKANKIIFEFIHTRTGVSLSEVF